MDNLLQMFRDALLISEPIYKTNELVWNKWNAYFKDVENNNNKVLTSSHASPSFTALVSWLEKARIGITLVQIYAKIDSYKEEIYKRNRRIYRKRISRCSTFKFHSSRK